MPQKPLHLLRRSVLPDAACSGISPALCFLQACRLYAAPLDGEWVIVQIFVRDNNVDQALKALKKKMQREGSFREMKRHVHYEKPSEKRARQKAEAVRRARKLARKRAQREGLLPAPKKGRAGATGCGRVPGAAFFLQVVARLRLGFKGRTADGRVPWARPFLISAASIARRGLAPPPPPFGWSPSPATLRFAREEKGRRGFLLLPRFSGEGGPPDRRSGGGRGAKPQSTACTRSWRRSYSGRPSLRTAPRRGRRGRRSRPPQRWSPPSSPACR